jgi:prenyltransferase beta subunit
MALRSARNAGLAVPTKVVEECIKYVKACQNADGGFSYFRQSGPQERRPSGFARSAAGVVALYSAGIYTGPEIDRGLHYLMQFKPGSGGFRRPDGPEAHYYYGQYYAAQAMWTAGGQFWAEWFPAIRDELLTRSRAARGYGGAWTDITTSDHYATAMACIILQIPNNYLPILQK